MKSALIHTNDRSCAAQCRRSSGNTSIERERHDEIGSNSRTGPERVGSRTPDMVGHDSTNLRSDDRRLLIRRVQIAPHATRSPIVFGPARLCLRNRLRWATIVQSQLVRIWPRMRLKDAGDAHHLSLLDIARPIMYIRNCPRELR
jgi:hypothetical protein